MRGAFRTSGKICEWQKTKAKLESTIHSVANQPATMNFSTQIPIWPNNKPLCAHVHPLDVKNRSSWFIIKPKSVCLFEDLSLLLVVVGRLFFSIKFIVHINFLFVQRVFSLLLDASVTTTRRLLLNETDFCFLPFVRVRGGADAQFRSFIVLQKFFN